MPKLRVALLALAGVLIPLLAFPGADGPPPAREPVTAERPAVTLGLPPLPAIDAKGLPPRTIVQAPAERPVPAWLRSNLRIGHLPGYNERMVKEFLKAEFNVVIVNALGKWDRVGPSAAMYPKEEVKAAEEYLRTVAETIHAAKAKALFY